MGHETDPGAMIFQVSAQVLLLLLLIVAAVTDLRDRKVYDWSTLPAMAFGLTLAWASGGPGKLWLHFFWGFVPAVVVFGLAVWAGGMGMGDLKLMAAIGAIGGFPFVLQAIFWSCLAGCLLALGKLAWKGLLWRGLARSLRFAFTLRRRDDPSDEPIKEKIPYGVAIAAGTLFAWFGELLGGAAWA